MTFGLFTSVAGFVGIVMTFVLMAITRSDITLFLFAPASLAVMNGSGRVLGLDYWVMPWLERKLNITLHGKQKSVYNDYNKK